MKDCIFSRYVSVRHLLPYLEDNVRSEFQYDDLLFFT